MPMSKLFIVDEKQMPVCEWKKEKFFIEILGLSKQADPWNRMFLYSDVIYEHNLSWEKLNEITLNLELDRL